jgi:hypothetical protein
MFVAYKYELFLLIVNDNQVNSPKSLIKPPACFLPE